jgi:anti-sigma B factor antagonist
MEITSRSCGSCLILDLNGKLVLGPATQKLRNTVREEVKKNYERIVLNLRNVTSIDSCGLGELVSSYTHAQSFGQHLVLLNPQDKILRLLIIAKLEAVFDIFHGEAFAIAGSNRSAVPA